MTQTDPKFDKRYGTVRPVTDEECNLVRLTYPLIEQAFRRGNQLYHFNNAHSLAGGFGYLIVRDGEVIGQFRTGMS